MRDVTKSSVFFKRFLSPNFKLGPELVAPSANMLSFVCRAYVFCNQLSSQFSFIMVIGQGGV